MVDRKIALITGASSGMGLAASIALLRAKYYVVMLCRDSSRGEAARQQAIKESGQSQAEVLLCDLASLDSIRNSASLFKERHTHLDVLINNAGVVSTKRHTTVDGFERMIGVNHLGHFLLTNLLLEKLQAAKQGRIITVSSGAHKVGDIHFPDPHLTNHFGLIKGYAQSKLANILFTNTLAALLADTNVTANSLHPGAVSTSLGVNRTTGFGKGIHSLLRPFFQSPAEGADTAIYLATDPHISAISGAYFYKRQIASTSKRAQDRNLADSLWKWSKEEVGLE